METNTTWHVIIPFRGGNASKTRLNHDALTERERIELARAFASDVACAALSTTSVASTTIITRDPETAQNFTQLGTSIFFEPLSAGLDGAVLAASQHIRKQHPSDGIVAIMGDLAGVTPALLQEALTYASNFERSVLADQTGTGTTLLAATGHALPIPSYGAGSFSRHVFAGHTSLEFDRQSPLRHDIDTIEDLRTLIHSGVGSHTQQILARIPLLQESLI